MKAVAVILTVLLNFGSFSHGQSIGTVAEMWTYDSSVDAGAFLEHNELQTRQISILLKDAEVKALMIKKSNELFEEKKALMIKAYGCGAHAASRDNVCEIVFLAFEPASDKSQLFGRLTARVNVQKRSVTNVQFSETR